MTKKNLSYFMRPELKEEKIVEVTGPDSITDENGNPVMFQIKQLTQETITKFYDMYKNTAVALDKKKKPYVVDGKVVMKETKDNQKAFRHILVEALVYPNLKDKELMDYYECVDVTQMPLKIFTPGEYSEVADMVNKVLGLDDEEEQEKKDQEDIVDAKN